MFGVHMAEHAALNMFIGPVGARYALALRGCCRWR